MSEKSDAGPSGWIDPDEIPELDDEFFETADVYEGNTLVKRGRPKLDAPKQLVSLRLDEDVLNRLRASGPGWQTRVNTALREWLDRPGEVREG